MVHIYACSQKKRLEEEKPIRSSIVDSWILGFNCYFLSNFVAFQIVYITFIIRGKLCNKKRLFGLS